MSAQLPSNVALRHRAPLRDQTKLWTTVYTLVGVCACFFNSLQAGFHDVRQFALYLISANVAVLGCRLMAGNSLLPAGFLVLLLGLEELSLPELLFIASTVTLFGALQRQHARPRVSVILFDIASIN